MPLLANDINFLLAQGLKMTFGTEYKEIEKTYPKYMEMVTSKKAYDEDVLVTGLGTWNTKGEGSDVDQDSPIQGFKKTYTNITYGRGFTVTMEAKQDELYNYIAKLPKSLARGAAYRQEIDAANILNRATNSSYTGGDAKVLAATDHPLYGSGGTYKNRPTTFGDLAEATLEQAYIDISAYVNDQNQKINAMAKKLVIPPDLRGTAYKLLMSGQEPGTANNAENPWKGYISWDSVVIVPWLTDTDQWNILTDVSDGLKFQMRMEPDLVQDNEPRSRNSVFTGVGRWVVGWTDPRGVYISTGG